MGGLLRVHGNMPGTVRLSNHKSHDGIMIAGKSGESLPRLARSMSLPHRRGWRLLSARQDPQPTNEAI